MITSHLPMLVGRAYRCHCGRPVFFRNSTCLACGTPLGYETVLRSLVPLLPGPVEGTWVVWQDQHADVSAPSLQSQTQTQSQNQSQSPTPLATATETAAAASLQLNKFVQQYARCANLLTPAACNWLVPLPELPQVLNQPQAQLLAPGNVPADLPAVAPPVQWLCQACRLNRTIPDLNDAAHPDNGELWGRIELAKRRLFSSLLALGLPVQSLTEDPVRGLAFDLLRSPDGGPPVMTGHHNGLITLNLLEADDAAREAIRAAMREPYRTLLGHFRHEIGHYYWERLVNGTAWLEGFRTLFGDDTQDYAAGLQKNYTQGPPPDWQLHYVSAYASSHPWEDWAECWAHYLHMRDTVDTAASLGLGAQGTDSAFLEFTPFTIDALYQSDHLDAQNFLDFLNEWTRLSTLLNEMSRSMGQPDFYPFVLPRDVVAKLHFVHLLVTSGDWTVNTLQPETLQIT